MTMQLIEEQTIQKADQQIPVLIYRKQKKNSSATFRDNVLRIYISHHVRGHAYQDIIEHFTNWVKGCTPQKKRQHWLHDLLLQTFFTTWDNAPWNLTWKWSTNTKISCRIEDRTIIMAIPFHAHYQNPEQPIIPDPNLLPSTAIQNCVKALNKVVSVYFHTPVKELLHTYHQKYFSRYSLGKLELRYMKARWGSCDMEGNITLNTQLLFLPPQYLTYVIIHELTHLQHKHHKPSFWKDVQTILPNYKEIRKELNTYA